MPGRLIVKINGCKTRAMLSRPANPDVLILSARSASLWVLSEGDNFFLLLSSMTGIFDPCTALRISQG